ncbi:MAG: hypothetical protein KAI47_20045 [Deltaproteobacteria bacterium]|nr:hypothetical protein [Deltaproteobacteria bacterium]
MTTPILLRILDGVVSIEERFGGGGVHVSPGRLRGAVIPVVVGDKIVEIGNHTVALKS